MDTVDSSRSKYIYDIQFPIFGISSNNKHIWTEDKVTRIQIDSGVYVLDNKNMQGDTLGQRRLRINNSKLYIPREVVHTVAQLIRSSYKLFIDDDGNVFDYIKKTRVPLNYYKVREVVKDDGRCILHFIDIDNPIMVSCTSAYGINYVGFLLTSIGYIAYDYSEELKPNTWRKI